MEDMRLLLVYPVVPREKLSDPNSRVKTPRRSRLKIYGAEGVTRLIGSGAPDRAAERRHKRDGSRDNNCRGYDGEQCR
jgi:hypothetical protein